MNVNPLKTLGTFDQSLWLDYIRRDLITSGQLCRLIEEDGLRGMTSNSSIFGKAIVDSHEYDEDIRAMALEGKGVTAIYDTLSQSDVQRAADEFRPVYDRTVPAMMAISAWRSILTWHMTRKPRLRKRTECGRRWPGPTSSSRSLP